MHRSQTHLARNSVVKSERPELHDSNSDAEVGILTAITGHGPTPPEGGASHHRSGGDYLTLCYTLRESENPLTCSAASNPCTHGAPRRSHKEMGNSSQICCIYCM
ncbi:hypothetical protein AVEN_82016-1 [Araneus ventricosus]|uniref:Uncharacterized protein n=1 Tax=Araneus ventricosus TaxID=182803 RepID=A0A4Y2UM03_ARAVE|nr:hypothetical protein AVEN_82016-1 [Araneus ventricosus]